MIFFIIGYNVNSQNNHLFTIGPDLSLPSKGSFGSTTNVSIRGSVQYQIKFAAPVGLQLQAGYSHFGDNYGKVSFLPIRVGVVGYLYQNLIYAYADAGASRYHSPTTGTTQTGFLLVPVPDTGYRLMKQNLFRYLPIITCTGSITRMTPLDGILTITGLISGLLLAFHSV